MEGTWLPKRRIWNHIPSNSGGGGLPLAWSVGGQTCRSSVPFPPAGSKARVRLPPSLGCSCSSSQLLQLKGPKVRPSHMTRSHRQGTGICFCCYSRNANMWARGEGSPGSIAHLEVHLSLRGSRLRSPCHQPIGYSALCSYRIMY